MGRTLLLVVWLVACGGAAKQIRKADGYMDKGHYPAAIRTYKEVLDKNPDNVKALEGTAEAWLASGHADRALTSARRGAKLGSNDARVLLVEALVATGRGAEAVDEAEIALGESNESPKLVRLLAEARLATGDLEGAKNTLEVGLEWSEDAEITALAAYLAYRTRDEAEAKELIAHAVDAGVGHEEIANVHADAAALFMMFGDDDRYRESLNILKSLVPDAEQRYLDAAVALATAGSDESAVRMFHWALALNPEDGRVARYIGLLLHDRKTWDLSMAFLQRAQDLPPYDLHTQRSTVLVERDQSGSMSEQEIQRDVLELYEALADCYYQTGRPLEAAETWERAIVISTTATGADWLRIAQIWERAGKLDRAAKAAFVVVEDDAKNGEAQFLLARVYAQGGDIDKAVGRARIAWELMPMNAEVALFLGRLYEKRMDFHAAYDTYATALERSPKDPRVKEAINGLKDR